MKKSTLYLILFLLFGVINSCKEQKNQKPVNNNEELRETLIKANQVMTQNEAEEINNYIKRHELIVENTGTGLRYRIKQNGNNILPDQDDVVTIEYKMNLLDGTVITNGNIDTLQFTMGRAEAPRGLEEGLNLIGEGGDIYLIIPSHLAFGRTGNDSSVPGNTPVVVNATLINVKKN
ncbi:MAG: FKBP-type peptidyl-prolyl cis-trans isomerase [Bacteroidia bacterium]